MVKRTRNWKDAQGRWRTPAGHYAAGPTPRKKSALPQSPSAGGSSGFLPSSTKRAVHKPAAHARGETRAKQLHEPDVQAGAPPKTVPKKRKGPSSPAPPSAPPPSALHELDARAGSPAVRPLPKRRHRKKPPSPKRELAPLVKGWLGDYKQCEQRRGGRRCLRPLGHEGKHEFPPPPSPAELAKKAIEAAFKGETVPEWRSKLPKRPEPRVRSEVLRDVERSKREHDQQARAAEEIRRSAEEAKKKLATDPKFGGRGAKIPKKDREHYERAVKRQEQLANRLEAEAERKKREIAKFAREAIQADELARARRRALRKGHQLPELEKLGKVSEWERRKRTAELLGRSEAQARGKYAPGELKLSFFTGMEKELEKHARRRQDGQTKEESWNDKLEAYRQTLWERGLRTPEEMALFLESEDMEQHDGYVLFYRY